MSLNSEDFLCWWVFYLLPWNPCGFVYTSHLIHSCFCQTSFLSCWLSPCFLAIMQLQVSCVSDVQIPGQLLAAPGPRWHCSVLDHCTWPWFRGKQLPEPSIPACLALMRSSCLNVAQQYSSSHDTKHAGQLWMLLISFFLHCQVWKCVVVPNRGWEAFSLLMKTQFSFEHWKKEGGEEMRAKRTYCMFHFKKAWLPKYVSCWNRTDE